jgi:hypothetical protein
VRREASPVAGRLPEIAQARHALLALLAEGARRFDAGEHWHAHESWEEAWKRDRGHDRDYLKGLIQIAAALHHWRRGHHAPAAKLLLQARAHLLAHFGPRFPIDNGALVRELDHAAALLQAQRPLPAIRIGRLLAFA